LVRSGTLGAIIPLIAFTFTTGTTAILAVEGVARCPLSGWRRRVARDAADIVVAGLEMTLRGVIGGGASYLVEPGPPT
jgi:hypothetical protein